MSPSKEKNMTASALFWDKIAEKYAARPVDDPAAFDRKIEITKSMMNADSVVLDVGCGTGSLCLRLADTGAEIHGLDISPEMMRIANDKRDAQGADNVTFHTGPFDESFDVFDDESLDGLLAYSILHLVPDRHAALAQMYRLIKPGGFFISSTVCLGRKKVFMAPMIGVMRAFGKAPMVKFFTAEELMDDMRAAGFTDVARADVGAKADIGFVVARKSAGQ